MALIVDVVPLLSGLLAGTGSTWFTLRGLRRRAAIASEGDGAASVAWSQPPVPLREQDPVPVAFIVVHALSVAGLAALFTWDRSLRPPGDFHGLPTLALLATSVLAGIAVGFLLVHGLAGAAAVRVGPASVTWGRHATDWGAFSHYAADASTRTIRLFSAGTPTVERMVWRPPSDVTFAQVLAVVRAALPDAPAAGAEAARRSAPVLHVGAWCAALLGVGALVAGTAWGWVYYLPAAFGLLRLAPALLRRYQLD